MPNFSRATPARGRPEPLPPRDGLNASRIRIADSPITALKALTHVISTQRYRHPADDASAIARRFINREVVLADATPLTPSDILAPGTDFWFYRMPAPEEPIPWQIRVVFEDENIVVIDKPPFLATTPRGRHITESVVVRMRRDLDLQEVSPAHRLDRHTSGLLLLTKRREVRGTYQELFAGRGVSKHYIAVAPEIAGLSDFPVSWTEPLLKQRGHLQAEVSEEGAPCVTIVHEATPLGHGLARYVLEPRTGRTHQLRAHMSFHRASIVGDPLYPVAGDPDDFGNPLLLHACRLQFKDPLSGEIRVFESDPRWDL